VNPTPLLYRSGSRLAGAYFSDSGCLLTGTLNEDLGPCIIYTAIVASNVGGPDNIAISSARWDDLIQFPVSVYRLAQDLGLPYETVRRYAAKLIARGLIERSSEGLIARHEVLTDPAIVGMLSEFSGMTVKMHSSLQAMGANLTTQGKIASPAHERRIVAMSIHYFLKGVKIATETLRVDPVPAMIHFTIHRANLAHLDPLPGSEVLELDPCPSGRRPQTGFGLRRRPQPEPSLRNGPPTCVAALQARSGAATGGGRLYRPQRPSEDRALRHLRKEHDPGDVRLHGSRLFPATALGAPSGSV